ncbi:MAG: hypothetical protein GY772_30525, partial [bacterium]|nr:hypothetical protein [bacterium]
MKWGDKKMLYGSENLIGVGGKLPPEQEAQIEKTKPPPRTKESKEPAFYHSYPPILYKELFRVVPFRAIIDLTPGEGNMALAAHELNIMYLGFTFNDTHTKMPMAHLETKVRQAMVQEDHVLYSPELHAALTAGNLPGGGSTTGGTSVRAGGANGRGRGKKGRGRGGRRGRAKRARAGDDEEGRGGGQGGDAGGGGEGDEGGGDGEDDLSV